MSHQGKPPRLLFMSVSVAAPQTDAGHQTDLRTAALIVTAIICVPLLAFVVGLALVFLPGHWFGPEIHTESAGYYTLGALTAALVAAVPFLAGAMIMPERRKLWLIWVAVFVALVAVVAGALWWLAASSM